MVLNNSGDNIDLAPSRKGLTWRFCQRTVDSADRNSEIPVNVENIVNTEICKEAFEDEVNENDVKTEDASKHGNKKIEVKICVDV